MKPLLLTISCLVGIFTLPAILAWLAAFAPWLIATILILGLIALSIADNWRHYAASIDQGLDFGLSSDNPEKQPLINDPVIDGSDSENTTTGGGVTSRRPLHKTPAYWGVLDD